MPRLHPCFCGTDLDCLAHDSRGDDDFRFEITPVDEPELGCTHVMVIRSNATDEVLEQFTTDDPYGAVEAAREAQAYTLEERLDMYAARGW